jgi:hypothetical protein
MTLAADDGWPWLQSTSNFWRLSMDDEDTEDIVGMYELLAAVEAVIQAADPKKRAALAKTIDAYAEGPVGEEFHWATGPQAPTLLHHLMMAIDAACRPESQSKPRPAFRLVDRKPEGNA